MMDIEALFAEADAVFEAVEPITVPAILGKTTVGVRFLPMRATEWRHLAAQHPPRPEVPSDRGRGYNVDAVVAAYPQIALIDESGDVDDLKRRREEDGKLVSLWPGVWERLTPRGQTDVATEIWAAHEHTPELAVEAAGKAFSG